MTFQEFKIRAFFPLLIALLILSFYAWCPLARCERGVPAAPELPVQPPSPAAAEPAPALPAPAPTAPPAPIPPTAAAVPAPAPAAPEGRATRNPAAEQERIRAEQIAAFDQAMDREFHRLEEREKISQDPEDLAWIAQLKSKLEALDQLYLRAETITAGDERTRLQGEEQQLMGEIIRLGRADRNQRLSKLAHSLGLTDEAQIVSFLQSVDQIVAETHLDWAALFNRGL